MGIMDKMKNIFFGDEYEEDYDDVEEFEDEELDRDSVRQVNSNVTSINRYSTKRPISNIVNINTSVQMGVCMFNPASLEDAAEVVSQIKDRNIVVVNLETVEYEISQRISDFLCGASYALEGNIQLISDKIMIIAPVNVEMSGELKDKLQASGIKIPNSMWR
ncbi:cell division protein SepF [uncultured Tyzzerella sp.]|uniref:cell division protein SepF n=1 Tax=uncultured Tyzzerella sp. TaxID=2321398 RepID=UPI0029436078|nr:cell division protein SepF [uncultured Tyzzerella sp.]